MNYYYDLPTDIINLIDDKVNNMYLEEHKDKMSWPLKIINSSGEKCDMMNNEIKKFVDINEGQDKLLVSKIVAERIDDFLNMKWVGLYEPVILDWKNLTQMMVVRSGKYWIDVLLQDYRNP